MRSKQRSKRRLAPVPDRAGYISKHGLHKWRPGSRKFVDRKKQHNKTEARGKVEFNDYVDERDSKMNMDSDCEN